MIIALYTTRKQSSNGIQGNISEQKHNTRTIMLPHIRLQSSRGRSLCSSLTAAL
jgi:hypothetical protein